MVHAGEDVEFVGLARARAVDAADHPAFIGVLAQRPVLIDADEDRPVRRRGDAGGIENVRRGREQGHVHARRRLQPGQEALVITGCPARRVNCRLHHLLAENLELKDARPGTGLGAGDVQANIAHGGGRLASFEAVLAHLVLVPGGVRPGTIGQHGPCPGIDRPFDLVSIAGAVLPGDPAADEFLRLAQIHLQPLRHGFAVGAPSRLVVAVKCMFGLVASLRRRRHRRLVQRQVHRHHPLCVGLERRSRVLWRRRCAAGQ